MRTHSTIFTTTVLVLFGSFACGDDPETASQRVLLVVSNHGDLGDTGEKTGVWMAELTHPYWALADSGINVTLELASPDGGDAPIDLFSVRFNFEDFLATGDPTTGDSSNERFMTAPETADWIAFDTVTIPDENGNSQSVEVPRFTNTHRLADVRPENYDAIYFAGGNGAMWQLPTHPDVHAIIREVYENGDIVSAACHGTAALLNTQLSNGQYLVEGRRVTGFSTAEEIYLGQDTIMPLLLQDAFGERGAQYIEAPTWEPNVVVDGRLISGQNPPSAEGVGETLVHMLRDLQ